MSYTARIVVVEASTADGTWILAPIWQVASDTRERDIGPWSGNLAGICI